MRTYPSFPRPRLEQGPNLLVVLSILLLLPSVGFARGLNPWDIARMRSVTDAVISPDGRHVAYVLSVPREVMVDDNGPSWAELHVYDMQSQASRRFVTGEVNVRAVQWTPDGRYIAFLAKRGDDEKSALYAIPIDGGESRRVLSWAEDVQAYAFSPDGSRLAFLAKEAKTEEQKELVEKGFDMDFYEEDERFTRVYVDTVDLDGSNAGERSEDEELLPLAVEGSVVTLEWSPVDDRLLVSLMDRPLIDQRYMFRRYHVLDSNDGRVLAVIETEGKLGGARFSPDGESIALIGAASINDPSEGRLMVVASSGGVPTDLLPELLGHVERVAWRDDNNVVYLASMGVQTEIGMIDRRGGEARTLFGPDQPVMTTFSVSGDGRQLAFVGQSPAHPSELFVAPRGELLRATNNNPWLTDLQLAEQRVLRWNARDDLELEGVLISPLDYVHGQRYPLIVVVHGGPESHESNGWKTYYSRPGQYAAAQGYFVFYPNYRGSTGRGVEFSLLSQGDPAGKEFDDVVDGVDHLVDAGLVDTDRVGITGGSYGGFASAWGATYYSERYAASVMFVGVSEQFSKFGTTDIPRESQLVHQHPNKVYDDWQFFLERSPIYHAQDAKTPLLILHGKEDPRVHPSQSMIMYRYFQHMADAPVRLVLYPGEPHGNRKAAGRLDYSLRLMRWMDHFLLEEGTELPPLEIDYANPESQPIESAGAR